MNLKEYRERKKEIENKAIQDIRTLGIYFVKSNNKYKVGDVITDHIGSVRYEKLSYYLSNYQNHPTAVYIGLELKKDGTPTKRKKERRIYGGNII